MLHTALRRIVLFILVCSTFASSRAFASTTPTGESPATAILDGVHAIATVGTPGVVAVFGPEAFPLVVGRVDAHVRAPVVAAGEYGSGRVVAFAHTGYFSPDALSKLDGERFLANAVRWASHRAKGTVRVGVSGGTAEFTTFLGAQGFEAQSVASVRGLDPDKTDVLFLIGGDKLGAEDQASLASFVQRGGGLFVAQTPWGWMQLNPNRSLATDHAHQALLAKAGLAWVDGTVDETAPGAFAVGAISELVSASRALETLLRPDAAKITREQASQARWSLLAPLSVLSRDDKVLRPGLAKLRAATRAAIPTASKPLKDDAALARLALALDLEECLSAPPELVRAHPAASEFPGAVPAGAPRVTRAITIDTRVPDWHSTGLYAAPGDVIVVERARDSKAAGLAVQIGSHTDDLTDASSWSRCPRVVVRAPLTGQTTRIASPFGGLVYVDVPTKCAAETTTIEIRNVVEAPRYVAGVTDAAQWTSRLRALPGPWAELESRKVVITVPSTFVRKLDDPAALLAFWDRVLDACADLAGIPRERPSPQRYVADQQISAGYMHSGYPIMTHLDVAPTFVDLAKLSADTDGCGWGFYHEMGHNHQRDAWTFEGTGEVTNNLFAVYVLDTVVHAVDARTTPEECKKRFDAYHAAGAKYETWKSDPFLALGFFLAPARAFGWKPFQAFFAEELALKGDERPRDDLDKRTQWLLRLSRATGRDLSPWFRLWNVPVHPDAEALLSDLPDWIAEGYPSK